MPTPKLFYTGIDLGKNSINNAVIQNLTTTPTGAKVGQIYFDTTDNNLYVCALLSNAGYTGDGKIASDNTVFEKLNNTNRLNLPLATTSLLGVVELANSSDFSLSSDKVWTNNNIHTSSTGATVVPSAQNLRDSEIRSKQYADQVAAGLDVKQSVKATTTGNISLVGGISTLDGVIILTGDRVLIKNQTSLAENGFYIYDGTNYVRSSDANSYNNLNSGAFVFVERGTLYANTGWVLSSTLTSSTWSTDAKNFTQFSAAGLTNAADGLVKIGNDLYVVVNDFIDTAYGLTSTGSGQLQDIRINLDNTGSKLTFSGGKLSIDPTIAGSGLQITGGGILAVKLESSNPSLQITAGELGLKIDSAAGLQKIANGTGIKLDIANPLNTLTLSTAGLLIANAATSQIGVVALASSAEAIAKTNTTKAVTPSGLSTFAQKFAVTVTTANNVAYNIVHGLATTDVTYSIKDNSTGDFVDAYVKVVDANTISITTSPSGTFRVVITG
jgi:hypothetical protein